MNKIDTFAELMTEVSYSWDGSHQIIQDTEGYSLNKLYITPFQVTYKTMTWELASGVYEKFEQFYALLQEDK